MIDGISPTKPSRHPRRSAIAASEQLDAVSENHSADPEPEDEADTEPELEPEDEGEPQPKDQPKSKPKSWRQRHRRALVAVAGLMLLTGGGAAVWFLTHSSSPRVAKVTATPRLSPTPVPTPITAASPLTGLQVDPAVASQPIVGVVIENHPDARPQSGLGSAGVVYEANAEGGITRFLAFFLDNLPATLGPIRSLRTYFVDWGLEFNAPIAHAGGNIDALDLVGPLHMKDLNALSFAQDGFYRSTDRYAPHNLYSSNAKLTSLLTRLNYNGPTSFTPSPRKADTPATTAAHPKVHIEFSYSGYQVDYTYDAAANDYARNMAGAPHIDRLTGKQIHVKNIVVEMMPTSYGVTRISEDTVIMQTVGKGTGWVMRDGDVVPVTWSKTSHTDRTQLLDASGTNVPLDAGNTWYEIVPTGKNVSF